MNIERPRSGLSPSDPQDSPGETRDPPQARARGGINYAGAGILPGLFSACHRLAPPSGGSDGRFGSLGAWAEGDPIDALIVKKRAPEHDVAEQRGARPIYIVTVRRGTSLRHGDVLRRDSDGLTLRVTADAIIAQTPETSTLSLAHTTAEGWDPPT